MNPPFSTGVKHVNHAFDIAPEGCTILALLNAESIRNPYLAIIAVLNWTNSIQFWYSDYKKDIPDEDVAIKINVTFFTPDQAEHFIDRELKAYYKELESTNSYRVIRTEYIKYP